MSYIYFLTSQSINTKILFKGSPGQVKKPKSPHIQDKDLRNQGRPTDTIPELPPNLQRLTLQPTTPPPSHFQPLSSQQTTSYPSTTYKPPLTSPYESDNDQQQQEQHLHQIFQHIQHLQNHARESTYSYQIIRKKNEIVQ